MKLDLHSIDDYVITQNDTPTINPVLLAEEFLRFNTLDRKKGYLRIAVLTADNRANPYWLIQIFYQVENDKLEYILNYAVYPNRNVLQDIARDVMTSVDNILGALNMAHNKDVKIYKVDNGKEYTDLMWRSFDIINSKVSAVIDSAIVAWLLKNPEGK